jgi:hypothetical protein
MDVATCFMFFNNVNYASVKARTGSPALLILWKVLQAILMHLKEMVKVLFSFYLVFLPGNNHAIFESLLH